MIRLLSKALLWLGHKLASEHTTHEQYDAWDAEALGGYRHGQTSVKWTNGVADLSYLDDEQWIESLKKGGHDD